MYVNGVHRQSGQASDQPAMPRPAISPNTPPPVESSAASARNSQRIWCGVAGALARPISSVRSLTGIHHRQALRPTNSRSPRCRPTPRCAQDPADVSSI
jgi:hypothetical protein